MKKVLVLGVYDNVMYHPLTGVDKAIKGMFPELELTMTDQIVTLREEGQYDCYGRGYPLCSAYIRDFYNF